MTNITSTNEEKVQLHFTPKTASGKDAKIEGDITYEVTAGDATVDSSDNRNPFIVSGDTAQQSRILASGDADLGEGIVLISEEIVYDVTLPTAISFGVTADAPVAK